MRRTFMSPQQQVTTYAKDMKAIADLDPNLTPPLR